MLHVFIGYRKSVYTKLILIKNSKETKQILYLLLVALGCRVHIIRVVDISRDIFMFVFDVIRVNALGHFLF